MRTTKLTVALLVGFLVLGAVLPATAQVVVTDSQTVESIIGHMQKALGALAESPPNLNRTRNQINKALNLMPDSAPPLGWFKIMAPYSWDQSKGPMPIQIIAMIDDMSHQPEFFGNVALRMMAYGRIVALYDTGMTPLPTFQTTGFVYGLWKGYVMLETSTGQTQSLGLHATDPVSLVAGNSNPVTWIVP